MSYRGPHKVRRLPLQFRLASPKCTRDEKSRHVRNHHMDSTMLPGTQNVREADKPDILEHHPPSAFNARAETVATSRTYREPFKKRRCLVPASGFYEWKRLDPKNNQPFAFDLANGKMMAFAGLWDAWNDPANGQWLLVHDRMPVILHPGDFERWLDRDSGPSRTDQPN